MVGKAIRRMNVEFRYFDRSTCSRCKATGRNAEKAIERLRETLAGAGVSVRLKTKKLPASRLGESNSVLINGTDIEALAGGKKDRRFTSCKGCSTLAKCQCDCRAYSYRGKKYPFIPKAMIREAVKKALGLGRVV